VSDLEDRLAEIEHKHAELLRDHAVLAAKVEAQDVASLRRDFLALSTEMRAGFARVDTSMGSVRGAVWMLAGVGGFIGLVATVIAAIAAIYALR
jgi:hypothetical protein